MTTRLRRFRRKFSSRGTFLMAFGFVYLILGYSILTLPDTPAVHTQVHKQLRLALQVMPLDAYATLWLIAGVIAIVAGFIQRWDMWGFGTAAIMPTAWSIVYFSAWNTIPHAWLSAAVYLLLAAAVLIVAGMPDPEELEELRRLIKVRSGE